MFRDKTLLVTGGTGSFGNRFTEIVVKDYSPKKIIIFSRDELKQSKMARQFSDHPNVRFLIGDIRDKDRLYRAFEGVNIVIHSAALKQVPACEYNPIEAIKTNINGAINIIDAAIDQGIEKVIALSTDKAASPINLYGATKLCSDKLFIQGNAYVGKKKTRFSVVRYGNVVGSRGSVVPLFMKLREKKVLPITDKRMTRFWITLDHGVQFVIDSLSRMSGGEIFVPKIPSMKITDLAKAIGPDCKLEYVGVRPGEKLHEVLIPEDEFRNAYEFDDHFVLPPSKDHTWLLEKTESAYYKSGKRCNDGSKYSSDSNDTWLNAKEIMNIIELKD